MLPSLHTLVLVQHFQRGLSDTALEQFEQRSYVKAELTEADYYSARFNPIDDLNDTTLQNHYLVDDEGRDELDDYHTRLIEAAYLAPALMLSATLQQSLIEIWTPFGRFRVITDIDVDQFRQRLMLEDNLMKDDTVPLETLQFAIQPVFP